MRLIARFRWNKCSVVIWSDFEDLVLVKKCETKCETKNKSAKKKNNSIKSLTDFIDKVQIFAILRLGLGFTKCHFYL